MEQTRKERQEKIVEILTSLHNGGSFEEAKAMFNEAFDGVDVTEITAAEKALIQSGLDPSEIQRLCNIHAAVFKGSINDIHRSNEEHGQVGHPVHTLKLENQVLQSLLTDEIEGILAKMAKQDWSQLARLQTAVEDLKTIDKHYTRKETLIFAFMEKYGITAPPKVMWGVDDQIREQIKAFAELLASPKVAYNPLSEMWASLKNEIEEMIFKEEEIMVPMTLDIFSLADWQQIAQDSYDIGFSFIPEPLKWVPSAASFEKEKENEVKRQAAIAQAKETTEAIAASLPDSSSPIPSVVESEIETDFTGDLSATIDLPTGNLQLDQLIAIFSHLPVDLTFVDVDEKVRFYSEGPHRIFPRTKSVIGREVVNCHPPKSMHIVQQILDDFRSGARTQADFWIDMRGMKISIRYYALHDEQGKYLGCLEVTQDITEIQKLSGQKRLLDE
ncbi:DUF438 domain-containing protein [Enterococcus columbae]|uniref:PAC domain-containing protein n=1 Tax=Enterococcus columbae DSM 7374 = ATCC 51263 TaxID=1121865 RepID=S1NSU0_9ENTE|nr:DUF438 domain-containing protein [Enterococcus columbae]EOT39949.1 hypothetical protein OMW_01738 [Enterococcus columbae DSM 7374 = ATCC 51263]EOW83934.1 hypothetical protein I568_01381 [Enterococcus columbae DSM 7374 = ATCC 51263]OJG25846.1 hypothetical protein RR47_GL001352 [Enterococcus columbae DSM 7374 = ATCC 51263]